MTAVLVLIVTFGGLALIFRTSKELNDPSLVTIRNRHL